MLFVQPTPTDDFERRKREAAATSTTASTATATATASTSIATSSSGAAEEYVLHDPVRSNLVLQTVPSGESEIVTASCYRNDDKGEQEEVESTATTTLLHDEEDLEEDNDDNDDDDNDNDDDEFPSRRRKQQHQQQRRRRPKPCCSFSAAVPLFNKADGGTTQIETIELTPFYKPGMSRLLVVEATVPVGIILGESEDFWGAAVVDEVAEETYDEQGVDIQPGDLVRGFTACQVIPAARGWGRPTNHVARYFYTADFRPFQDLMNALASNRLDPTFRRVYLVLERKNR